MSESRPGQGELPPLPDQPGCNVVASPPTLTEPPLPPAEPFSLKEILRACLMPWEIIEMVLSRRDRMVATLRRDETAGYLVILLLLVSILLPVPFSLLSFRKTYYDVTLIYTGTLLICFPSLFVFSRYLEIELSTAQILAAALLISSCAAILSIGWAPVIWFIDMTIDKKQPHHHTTETATAWLLWSSLLLGFIHMIRVVNKLRRGNKWQEAFKAMVTFFWAMLFWWIASLMAQLLEA